LVSFIIVNYNTANVLNDCIESVFKFEKPGSFEIIVVDNCSTDDSKDTISEIREKYTNVQSILLENPESFSYANNKGIESASGEFIIIMNPDIIFTEPLIDKLLADFKKDSTLGAITPALVGTDGKFQRSYFQRYPTIMQYLLFHTFYAKFFFRFPKLMNRWLENQDVDINQKKLWYVEQIPCAFFMTPAKTLRDIGMMDEKFVLFFEDVDLSYRVNKLAKLAVDSELSVTHLGGSSFRNEDSWKMYGRFVTSMCYYLKKHHGALRSFILKIFAVENSIDVLIFEYIKKIAGKSDEYRIKKHKNLLKLII
jgi:GT2 family glycosyltransferase